MTSPHDRSLDLIEAGELLGTGPEHVQQLIASRQLPAQSVGDALLVLESALVTYLVDCEIREAS